MEHSTIIAGFFQNFDLFLFLLNFTIHMGAKKSMSDTIFYLVGTLYDQIVSHIIMDIYLLIFAICEYFIMFLRTLENPNWWMSHEYTNIIVFCLTVMFKFSTGSVWAPHFTVIGLRWEYCVVMNWGGNVRVTRSRFLDLGFTTHGIDRDLDR